MLLHYLAENKKPPKTMVLYTWIVPCVKQSCPSKGTSGCTSHTIKNLKNYAKETKVIVAYTTLGGGMSGITICDASKTEKELQAAGIDVIRIEGNFEEVAMIKKSDQVG